jgi:hemerythrin-like metal-binding protein
MRLDWNDMLIVGVEQIDLQHQELFRHINRLLECAEEGKREETAQTIGFLQDYVIFHFGDEEQAMADHAYPQASIHKNLHQEFRDQFLQLKEKLMRGDRDTAVIAQTKAWLVDWWLDHINRVDREMAGFLIRHPIPKI